MKVFVTVGSTQFNRLIQAIDEQVLSSDYEVIIQLADGKYIPENHQYIRVTDNINQYFSDADIVICHAGAGSVFNLLELQKKMVVVPNSDRINDHQLDLAHYIEKNNFASVCYDLNNIKSCLVDAGNKKYEMYANEPFFGYQLIADLLSKK